MESTQNADLAAEASEALGGPPTRPPVVPVPVDSPELAARREAFAAAELERVATVPVTPAPVAEVPFATFVPSRENDAAQVAEPLPVVGPLVPQRIARVQLDKAPVAELGHSIFDTPTEITDRAAKVSDARARLSALTRQILAEAETLLPVLHELSEQPAAVSAEKFQPTVATAFLTDLVAVVRRLVP